MKKLLLIGFVIVSFQLIGCTASIGTPSHTTTYTTPVVSDTYTVVRTE